MRIAIGIHHLRPRGGQEDHCIRIAEALIARGHDVTVFSNDDAGDLTIPVVAIPDSGLQANHARAARFAVDFRELTKTGFERRIAFQPVPGVDILFIGEDLRNRRDSGLLKRLTPRFRTFRELEIGCFGAGSNVRIIGFSTTQMRAFAERYPDCVRRTAILPPTLQPDRYRPDLRSLPARMAVRRSLGVADGEKAWLWVGLQPEIKGLDRVLDALAEQENARLLICGLQAEHHKSLRVHGQINNLGLSDRVRFMGYVTGDQYSAVLAAADVLAHPARREASGSTILEALVNGLPVVATDICGFAVHIEKSGAGIVVPSPFDPADFRDALRRVCGGQRDEFSRRGIAYGADPLLYSGIEKACDLVEAVEWPTLTGF